MCGISPREVDGLAVVDFLILADGVDARWKLRQDALEKGGFWAA